MGRGDSAIAGFQRVVLDEPGSIDGWLGLGEALFHYGGVTGHAPADARPAFEQLVELDSVFAPVYDHLFNLALYRGDSAAAQHYLTRLRVADPVRPALEAAFVSRFGSPREVAAVLRRLPNENRQVISELVALLMHGSFNLPLADTVASTLLGPKRTPDGTAGVVPSIASLHWRARTARWRGWPSGGLRRGTNSSMHGWCRRISLATNRRRSPLLCFGGPTACWIADKRLDFSLPLSALPQQAFQALVHRATIEGDSSEVAELMRHLGSAAHGSDSTDPEHAVPSATHFKPGSPCLQAIPFALSAPSADVAESGG